KGGAVESVNAPRRGHHPGVAMGVNCDPCPPPGDRLKGTAVKPVGATVYADYPHRSVRSYADIQSQTRPVCPAGSRRLVHARRRGHHPGVAMGVNCDPCPPPGDRLKGTAVKPVGATVYADYPHRSVRPYAEIQSQTRDDCPAWSRSMGRARPRSRGGVDGG